MMPPFERHSMEADCHALFKVFDEFKHSDPSMQGLFEDMKSLNNAGIPNEMN